MTDEELAVMASPEVRDAVARASLAGEVIDRSREAAVKRAAFDRACAQKGKEKEKALREREKAIAALEEEFMSDEDRDKLAPLPSRFRREKSWDNVAAEPTYYEDFTRPERELVRAFNTPEPMDPSEESKERAVAIWRAAEPERWAVIDNARRGETAEDAIVNEAVEEGRLFGVALPDILRMDRWPHDTGRRSVIPNSTPRYWLRCCIAMSEGKSPEDAAVLAGLSGAGVFYAVKNRYVLALSPVLRALNELRSHRLASEAATIVDDDSGDLIERREQTAGGAWVVVDSKPNSARVKRDDMRAKFRMSMAARLNHEEYGDKQVVENRNQSLNVNLDVTPEDLLKMSVEDIQMQIGKMKQGC